MSTLQLTIGAVSIAVVGISFTATTIMLFLSAFTK